MIRRRSPQAMSVAAYAGVRARGFRFSPGMVLSAPPAKHGFSVNARLHRIGCRAFDYPIEFAAVQPNATTLGATVHFHPLSFGSHQLCFSADGTFPGVAFWIQVLLLSQQFHKIRFHCSLSIERLLIYCGNTSAVDLGSLSELRQRLTEAVRSAKQATSMAP